MQAVPAMSALLIRRARPSPLASPGDGRPRRHATERGTRQDQPQSRQTLSYSAASQSTRIVPLYPPASGLEVQPVLSRRRLTQRQRHPANACFETLSAFSGDARPDSGVIRGWTFRSAATAEYSVELG